MGRLSASSVRAAKAAGTYGDGDGLFLLVAASGGRSWVCRIQKNGKRRDIGLGSEKKVSLAQARERAAKVRSQIEAGIDPVAERRKEIGIPTFREAAAMVFAENHKTWRNPKHRAQWISTLSTYAFPTIGDVSVGDVEGPAVRDVLVAIWLTKPETARRVRQRIATVIDWAIAKGYRTTPIPMTALSKSLPKSRVKAVHHTALPYTDVPQFIARLRERESIGRLALETAILTATRSGEVRLATWSEIDVERGVWTIPAKRMKAGVEHVVPLSVAVLKVFARARELREVHNDFVFPGAKSGKPLSDMTLTKICRDFEVDAVPHGFRSSFRDWVSEETEFKSEVAEMALAHTIENKVEAAYRRGDLLKKRRIMMDAWSDHCAGESRKIVQLVRAG
jgi:integrase